MIVIIKITQMKFEVTHIMIKAAKNLTVIRVKKGFNKSDLARAAGINHSVVVKAEQGENISPKSAHLICQALECSFDDAFIISHAR